MRVLEVTLCLLVRTLYKFPFQKIFIVFLAILRTTRLCTGYEEEYIAYK